MYKTIEEYLDALKEEMKGNDIALLQDAMADAREHLTMALASAREAKPDLDEAETLRKLIEEYGSPEETASAYKEVERRTTPTLKQTVKHKSVLDRLLSVYVDPRTWGSLLFMFIAFVTGIIYFTWAVTGLSLSISFLILIIGVPFAILFLLSVQGLALLEGRLVEALLGVRMPRRPLFAQPGLKWLDRLKTLLTDKHTWLSLLYMVLQMPLGIIYFSVMVTLLSFSIGAMASPFTKLIWKMPMVSFGANHVFQNYGSLILLAVGGFITLTLTMHLTRAIGWLHGRYAKLMLVSE